MFERRIFSGWVCNGLCRRVYDYDFAKGHVYSLFRTV